MERRPAGEDGDDVEAEPVAEAAVLRGPGPAGGRDLPTLPPGDRLQRVPVPRTRPRPDLHEGDDVSTPRHQVQLLVAPPPVAVQHLVACALKERAGPLFGECTEVVMCGYFRPAQLM
jgi:hypothetical protein